MLGIFGGIINDPDVPLPPTPKRGVRPYLRRPDGYWVDFETELPYPLPPQGSNYNDFIENFEYQKMLRGLENELQMVRVS